MSKKNLQRMIKQSLPARKPYTSKPKPTKRPRGRPEGTYKYGIDCFEYRKLESKISALKNIRSVLVRELCQTINEIIEADFTRDNLEKWKKEKKKALKKNRK